MLRIRAVYFHDPAREVEHGSDFFHGFGTVTSRGRGFVLFSLFWLPAGLVAVSAVRGMPVITLLEPQAWLSLAMIAPCGLPLALAWKKIRCVGHPAVAWMAFAVLAPATAASSMFAGLLGPVAIAAYAVVVYTLLRWKNPCRGLA